MSSKQEALLPQRFQELDRFSRWVVDEEIERRNLCVNSDMEEIQEFYNVLLSKMDEIIVYLNGFPLDGMELPERNLLSLVQAFVEAAASVEMFGQPEILYGMPVERFQPVHHLVPEN